MTSITSAEFRAGKGKAKQKQEESIQIQLADYMRGYHSGVIFRSDFAAGIKMTMGQAMRHKRMQESDKYPDFFVAKPVGKYAGLYLELKKSREGVWLKDGTLSTKQHIQEQAAMLRRLEAEGYCARFACGITEAVVMVRCYLEGLEIPE